MRVILRARTGAATGRTAWVRDNQKLEVGRTEAADFVIAEDGSLSSLHFAVETFDRVVRLRDLNSRNGTFVNGMAVSEPFELQTGDEILAGQTTFDVSIEGGPGLESKPRVSPAAVTARLSVRSTAIQLRSPVHFSEHPGPAGWSRFVTEEPQPGPAEMARFLASLKPLRFALDCRKASVAVPPASGEPAWLCDWYPADARPGNSPLLIDVAALPEAYALMETAWGKDAVVVYLAAHDQAGLLSHLRGAARFEIARSSGEPEVHFLGHFWPKVLAPMLSLGSPQLIEKLLVGIEAILIEDDRPSRWQLFAPPQFGKQLEAFGFVRAAT